MKHDHRPQSDLDLPNMDPVEEGVIIHISLSDALRNQHERIVRRRYAKTSVREYLTEISDPELSKKYLSFYDAHPFFSSVCAGAKHHHYWVGGLDQHTSEIIGICLDIRDLYRKDVNSITKDDIIIAGFLHDWAKVFTYRFIEEEEREKNPHKFHASQVFTYEKAYLNLVTEEDKTLLELGKFGINPTELQWSAVCFAEGGFSQDMFDFGGPSRTGETIYSQNPLAVLIHMGDLYSSQILGQPLI